jgi:DNA polymerase-3 subunit epsilon
MPFPPWDQALESVTFAVVDVETTGLNPAWGHRVCEIAVLRGRVGGPPDAFSSLVDPGRDISPGAFAVNGITQAMLRGAPAFAAVAEPLLRQLDGAVLVAHNAPFDLSFLHQELMLAGHAWPDELVAIDTLALCRQALRLPRNGLSYVGRALGVLVGPEHRALGDVHTTWGVLQHVMALLRPQGVRTLGDLITWQGGPVDFTPVQEVPLPPSIAEALGAGGRVLMRYADARGRKTERLVRPLRVWSGQGRGYLVAYCYLRNARRTFRLDRVIEMIPDSAWSDG